MNVFIADQKDHSQDKAISLTQDDDDVNIRVNGKTVAYFDGDGELVIWKDSLDVTGFGLNVNSYA